MYWCKILCKLQFPYHNRNSTVRQEKCGGRSPPLPIFLLSAEGSAVGALVDSRVSLVGTNQDSLQRAIVGIIAVISTLVDSAFDALVCMTAHKISSFT
jgi:hypothetical protein